MGRLVVKPGFLRDLAEEYQAAVLLEDSLARRLAPPAVPHAQPLTRSLASASSSEELLQQYRDARTRRIRLGEFLPLQIAYFLCSTHPFLPRLLFFDIVRYPLSPQGRLKPPFHLQSVGGGRACSSEP